MCVFLSQLWLCLAALCVIDEEHAEALSSGQWLGQDGKPKDKVRAAYTENYRTYHKHTQQISQFFYILDECFTSSSLAYYQDLFTPHNSEHATKIGILKCKL